MNRYKILLPVWIMKTILPDVHFEQFSQIQWGHSSYPSLRVYVLFGQKNQRK